MMSPYSSFSIKITATWAGAPPAVRATGDGVDWTVPWVVLDARRNRQRQRREQDERTASPPRVSWAAPIVDIDELYGLPLDRFIPERAKLAKELSAAGERDQAVAVAALKKPSAAAWAVNQLVRTQGKALAELFHAGDALRSAQSDVLKRPRRQRAISVPPLSANARPSPRWSMPAAATQLRRYTS